MPTSSKCPDCGGALAEIAVVDRNGGGPLFPPVYTRDKKPKLNAWSGGLKNVSGYLQAAICQACRRVFFYGSEDGTDGKY